MDLSNNFKDAKIANVYACNNIISEITKIKEGGTPHGLIFLADKQDGSSPMIITSYMSLPEFIVNIAFMIGSVCREVKVDEVFVSQEIANALKATKEDEMNDVRNNKN